MKMDKTNEMIEKAKRLLNSSDLGTRRRAFKALLKYVASHKDDDVADLLASLMVKNPGEIFWWEEYIEVLVPYLMSKINRSNAQTVIGAIAMMESDRGIKALLQILREHPDEQVRLAALREVWSCIPEIYQAMERRDEC